MVNYSCDICSKVFKQKGHLEVHKNRKLPCKKDNTIEQLVEKKVQEVLAKTNATALKIEPIQSTNATSNEMDYTKKTVHELKALCKERKIKGISGKSKTDLIAMLGPSTIVVLNTTEVVPTAPAKIKAETDVKVIAQVKVEEEMSSESAHTMLIRIIQQQKEKEDKQDIWKNSPYKDLVKLQSNNVGNVGEELINHICKTTGIDADCNGANKKQIGGGKGDGKIMNIPVEIKTAHRGSRTPTFQHELGEVPWKGSKYMIFVDISPECIYLTIFKNFDEKTCKSNKKLPCVFPTKTITWRKKIGAFKLDITVNINELNVKNGHAIKITPTTSNDTIASFIRKIVV